MWLVSVVCLILLAHWLSHTYKMVKSYPITLLELLKNSVSHIVACTVLKLILGSLAENECLSLCTTFFSHLMLSGLAIILACSSLGMSIICCTPVWKIQNHFTTVVLTYTSSTTDNRHQSVNFSRFTSLSSEKLNHGPLVLLGQLHHLVHHLQTAL